LKPNQTFALFVGEALVLLDGLGSGGHGSIPLLGNLGERKRAEAQARLSGIQAAAVAVTLSPAQNQSTCPVRHLQSL
jgi:hypothetical protein